DPVDLDVAVELVQRAGDLLLQHVGERTGRAGQRHVDDDAALVYVDPVDQSEVDHVDAELRVDDVLERVSDLLHQRFVHLGGLRLRRGGLLVSGAHTASSCRWVARDLAVASFHAIQASRAHLTRAGYFDTPAKATASCSTSSSGSPCPLDCMSAVNSSRIAIASSTVLPMSRSAMTEALAWLMEQPMLS